jgi:hypothetical protein
MLCDELIAKLAPESGCDITPIIPRLKQAQKFTLSPEFAAVAEALSEDYSGLVRVFERCRLPYPETWVEFAQADRPRFMASGMHHPQMQRQPKRVGFLMSATRADLSAWKTHQFWNFENGMTGGAFVAMQADMTQELHHTSEVPSDEEIEQQSKALSFLERDHTLTHPGWLSASDEAKLMMVNHTELVQSDCPPIIPPDAIFSQFTAEHWTKYALAMRDLSRSDWAGEGAYVLAVIGLLNARNAVELEPVDISRLNKARIKSGKHPLQNHKILKIAHRQIKRVYADGEKHPTHAPMRGHFVRGHFKARKSGIFFWHPFARGHFERGTITKDYRL